MSNASQHKSQTEINPQTGSQNSNSDSLHSPTDTYNTLPHIKSIENRSQMLHFDNKIYDRFEPYLSNRSLEPNFFSTFTSGHKRSPSAESGRGLRMYNSIIKLKF